MTAISAVSARLRVDRIKVGVEAVWQLVVESYQARDWEALGYSSWDDMCTREFGTSRLRLPREERVETVQSLRDAGLSLRAISAATGGGYGTIQRALSGDPNGSPAPESVVAVDHGTGEVLDLSDQAFDADGDDEPLTQEQCEALDAQPVHAEPAAAITGLDGKTYSRPATEPQPLRRRPITDEFRGAVLDLGTKVARISRLGADDRFSKNADQISQVYLHDLIRARDALQCVIDQLQPQERTQ